MQLNTTKGMYLSLTCPRCGYFMYAHDVYPGKYGVFTHDNNIYVEDKGGCPPVIVLVKIDVALFGMDSEPLEYEWGE